MIDVAAAVASTKQLVEIRTVKHVRLDQYKEFCDILRIKYNNNEDEINKHEDYEFDRLITFGLSKYKNEETGYELIHKGKPADKRVLKKLGRIAFELKEVNTYPIINMTSLHVILNKALGDMDIRTMRGYRKTVLYYCNVDEDVIDKCKDIRLGEQDVSGFVRRVPSSFVTGDDT